MMNIISIKTFFGDDESTKKVRECSMSDRMRGQFTATAAVAAPSPFL